MTRWVKQTRLHDAENGIQGNCTEAAVASLLGLPIDAVPDFMETGGGTAHGFWDAFEEFFASKGMAVFRLNGEWCLEALHLASGPSPRGVPHMVVMKEGKVVHDPHPSDAGIVSIDHVWLIVPFDVGGAA